MSFANAGWGAPLPVQLDGNVTDEYVTKSTTQTITGEKTFDSESLVVDDLKLAADGSVMTFPTGGNDNVVTTLAAQEMTNKGMNMEAGYFYSDSGTNRRVKFRFNPSAPIGNNTTSEIRFVSTADRTWTHPDTSGTYAMTSDIPSVSSLVTGPASAVSANIATYNGTTGKLIQDSGVATTNIPNQTVNTTSSPTFATQTLTTGLLLPTTGGTQTTLTYYEEGTFNLTFTGPFTATVACNFVRVGKMVNFNMNWTTNQVGVGGFFTTNGLPARLVPAIAVDCQIWITDLGVSPTTPGRIVVLGTNISVYKSNVATNFAAGVCSFNNWSWTWRI